MACKISTSLNPNLFNNSPTSKPTSRPRTVTLSSLTPKQEQGPTTAISNSPTVAFRTLPSCKLGISRYPDFDYNAQGGTGTGISTILNDDDSSISVTFDLETLYIPPLTGETTRFLGLPLPPGLRIDIVPVSFQGNIAPDLGDVDLEFVANFCFSVGGSLYRAPPLLVKTVLTTGESRGVIRSGRGERLDEEGKCRLVGVATVDRINDWFMNTFLGLPTECLAVLNAVISVS